MRILKRGVGSSSSTSCGTTTATFVAGTAIIVVVCTVRMVGVDRVQPGCCCVTTMDRRSGVAVVIPMASDV